MVSGDDRIVKERIAAITHELRLREERRKQAAEGGLLHFVRYFWDVLEPNRPFIEGWVLDAICEHLEAITFGDIRRLLVNVSPGSMKSLLTNVFFPAWEWGPMNMPHLRYLSFSYGAHLTQRDNEKFRNLIRSRKFQEMWGHVFTPDREAIVKVSNDKTGFKFATSVDGIGTGERGDRVLLDDPHNVREGESDAVRTSTVRFFRESMSNRLNDMRTDPIIVIMQRVHEHDVAGEILSSPELGYESLIIPMEFDGRRCSTSIGWTDPRTQEGELAWPERFPAETLAAFKSEAYMWAGQYQQAPEPRGGGIIKRHYWQYYTPENAIEFGVKANIDEPLKFPPFEYIVAALDPAYTEKDENDPSGFVICGVFYDKKGRPNIMLIMAWRKWLELHGEIVEKEPNEPQAAYINRAKESWGLVEWVAHECRRWRVDRLLIEGKASGLSVAQEMRRLYGRESWGTQIVNPSDGGTIRGGGNDKTARLWSIQHLFQDGLIWVPCGNAGTKENPVWYPKDFAQLAIDDHAVYPKSYKDIVDSMVYALKHLRRADYALRKEEFDIHDVERRMLRKKLEPLYDV